MFSAKFAQAAGKKHFMMFHPYTQCFHDDGFAKMPLSMPTNSFRAFAIHRQATITSTLRRRFSLSSIRHLRNGYLKKGISYKHNSQRSTLPTGVHSDLSTEEIIPALPNTRTAKEPVTRTLAMLASECVTGLALLQYFLTTCSGLSYRVMYYHLVKRSTIQRAQVHFGQVSAKHMPMWVPRCFIKLNK